LLLQLSVAAACGLTRAAINCSYRSWLMQQHLHRQEFLTMNHSWTEGILFAAIGMAQPRTSWILHAYGMRRQHNCTYIFWTPLIW